MLLRNQQPAELSLSAASALERVDVGHAPRVEDPEPLRQPRRQLTEQRQFEALALPCLERQNNPQEQHGQRSQNSKQQKNHGGSDIRKQERENGQNEKGSPKQNALPGMKADETVAAKSRQEQERSGRDEGEISDGRGRAFRGNNRSHRPSASRTEYRVCRHRRSAMGAINGSLRRIRCAIFRTIRGNIRWNFF